MIDSSILPHLTNGQTFKKHNLLDHVFTSQFAFHETLFNQHNITFHCNYFSLNIQTVLAQWRTEKGSYTVALCMPHIHRFHLFSVSLVHQIPANLLPLHKDQLVM
ncbi:hypothetical protein Hanom_Chr03g00246941 [Helianthus anomalus]